ncbi:MAG: hypothetical protein WCP92_07570 [bacterium]
METWKDGKIEGLTVRPRLHCPDIDAYDEITVQQVIGTFEDKATLDI